MTIEKILKSEARYAFIGEKMIAKLLLLCSCDYKYSIKEKIPTTFCKPTVYTTQTTCRSCNETAHLTHEFETHNDARSYKVSIGKEERQ